MNRLQQSSPKVKFDFTKSGNVVLSCCGDYIISRFEKSVNILRFILKPFITKVISMKRRFNKVMNIGKNVAKYREAKGLSQQELADRVHIAQATIARLEKDTKIPSFEIMAQIASVLECSLDDLHGN